MQKIDLDSLSIDDLAALLDQTTDKLADRIAARQRELTAEMEKLAALGRKIKTAGPKKDLKAIEDALTPQAAVKLPQKASDKPQDAKPEPKTHDAVKTAIKAA